MFITCKCVALRSIPVIFSSRHYAKWNRHYQASVGIKMQCCWPTSPESRGCVPCMCVCTYQATYVPERHTSHLAYMWCLDLAHTVINIRNVAAFMTQESLFQFLRGKIHPGFFWRVSHWLTALATFYCCVNTDDIFIFLEFSQTQSTLYKGGSVFLLFRVWGGWENRGRNVEVTYPNHRRNLNCGRHFREGRPWNFP